MCLLHVLHRLAPEWSLGLHVAHLNHGWRGAAAEEDARFVAAVARELELPATIEARDVSEYRRRHRLSPEDAARRVRYAYLAEVARSVGAGAVATGHTEDDQAETVLLAWLRGSGGAGLRGMGYRSVVSGQWPGARGSVSPGLAVSDAPDGEDAGGTSTWRSHGESKGGEATKSVFLVRPLLDLNREQTEAYCRAAGLSWRDDPTNRDPRYLRNRVRAELLPALERVSAGARAALLRSARLVARDHDYLTREATKRYRRLVRVRRHEAVYLDAAGWRALHPALQAYVLRHALAAGGRQQLYGVEAAYVEAALALLASGRTGGRVRVSEGVTLTMEYDLARLGSDEPARHVAQTALQVPGSTVLESAGWVVEVALARAPLAAGPDAQRGRAWDAHLDAGVVSGALAVRAWEPGDRIQPAGFGRHRKLQDVLTDLRVPRRLRRTVPLLVAGERIAWMPGYRVADWARVTPDTREVVSVRLRPIAGARGAAARELRALHRRRRGAGGEANGDD